MKQVIQLFLGLLISAQAIAMDYLIESDASIAIWPQNAHDFYEVNPIIFAQQESEELSTENKQLFKLNIHFNKAVNTIKESHPQVLAWTKTPDDKQTVEKLPALSTTLQEQTNIIEAWLRQISSRNTASFIMLRDTIEAFEKSLNTIEINHEKKEKLIQIITEDLSHPVGHFLHIFELLKGLVRI